MFDISWRPDGNHAHEHNRGHEIRQQTTCGSNNYFYACVKKLVFDTLWEFKILMSFVLFNE